MRWLLMIMALMLGGVVSQPLKAEALGDAIRVIDADVVFMRHALAPGYGDPDDFDIRDCSTQRNLDDEGRDQARNIGRHLRNNKIRFDAILSSQWCRCRDTAIEMGIGDWSEFAGLNSFFEGHVDRGETLRLLKSKLAQINPGERVLMVTHQVVIQAATGISPRSGGMVVHNTRTGASLRVQLD
ncbi:MAG: Uncharacterised protein [SAR116 cluster bacterium MED-G04]|nr:MAG: Uncharacterised protein [SAR116 cluster bacterium MED-G04]